MNRLKELYDVTLKLKEVLDQHITAKNREAVIAEINKLVDLRGNSIQNITPPYTEEEKQCGNELVQLNVDIQKQMQSLFEDLKMEMKQVKQQKKSNNTYLNPYKNIHTADGMFMDRKN